MIEKGLTEPEGMNLIASNDSPSRSKLKIPLPTFREHFRINQFDNNENFVNLIKLRNYYLAASS